MIEDYKGIKYTDQTAMCNAYGIKVSTYRARISTGWSQKDALLPLKRIPRRKDTTTDHLGNVFDSEADMAKAYDVDPVLLHTRLVQGMSIENALTKPKQERGEVVDHKGVKYPSFKAMCKEYGKDITMVKKRIDNGMSLKDALETSSRKTTVKDHLGNVYPSLNEMCETYSINRTTYNNRIRSGWTVRDALETPTVPNGKGVYKRVDRQNEKKEMGNGLVAEVVEYINRHNIIVRFTFDGETLHASYKDYETGNIGHPKLNPKGNRHGTFCGFKTYRIEGKYFSCECKKCGFKDILTPQEMIKHSKECI